jgi:hypothetical protein
MWSTAVWGFRVTLGASRAVPGGSGGFCHEKAGFRVGEGLVDGRYELVGRRDVVFEVFLAESFPKLSSCEVMDGVKVRVLFFDEHAVALAELEGLFGEGDGFAEGVAVVGLAYRGGTTIACEQCKRGGGREGVDVEEDGSSAQCAVDDVQGVNDALSRHASYGPREDGNVEGVICDGELGDVGRHEGDAAPEFAWGLFGGNHDRGFVGVDG